MRVVNLPHNSQVWGPFVKLMASFQGLVFTFMLFFVLFQGKFFLSDGQILSPETKFLADIPLD